jgi:hypothetical protein
MSRTTRNEDEFPSWAVGRIADVINHVSKREEVPLDFLPPTEAQRRIRGQDWPSMVNR